MRETETKKFSLTRRLEPDPSIDKEFSIDTHEYSLDKYEKSPSGERTTVFGKVANTVPLTPESCDIKWTAEDTRWLQDFPPGSGNSDISTAQKLFRTIN